MKVKGRITEGVGHFRVRMTRYPDVFERATGSCEVVEEDMVTTCRK